MKHIFDHCRRYSISLNPKKRIFAILEGKLLGHIISKKGISIDQERVEAKTHIPMPYNRKAMQSFMGTINFVQSFFPDFSEIVKPLQQMVKQSVQFKWIDIEKVALKDIKTTIAQAPSLRSLYFENDFILYTFASDNSLAAVLTQKGELGDEYPISFMTSSSHFFRYFLFLR